MTKLRQKHLSVLNKKKAGLIMQGLSEDALIHVAEYFSALAQPTRLAILNTLRSGEHSVGELASICESSQANVSRHLSTLAKQGIVRRESKGNTVYYAIADANIYTLCDLVCGNVAKQLETRSTLMTTLKKKRK